MIYTCRWDESRFDDSRACRPAWTPLAGHPRGDSVASRLWANAATALCRAAAIESRIMKSPIPLLIRALGHLTAAEKSNYATTLRGTAISGLKTGHFAGLGADSRAGKSNCADAASRATTGFFAENRLGKVELSSRPPAAAVRRTYQTVTCGASRLIQAIKTPSRLAGRPRRQHSMGIVGTETAPAFRHRAKGARE